MGRNRLKQDDHVVHQPNPSLGYPLSCSSLTRKYHLDRRTLVVLLAGAAAAVGIVGAPAPASAARAATSGSSVSAPTPAPNGVAGTDRTVSFPVGGVVRSYRLFVPTNLPAGGSRLIVALHPLGGTAAGFEQLTNLDAGAALTGVLMAYPAGLNGSWDAGTCCGTAQSTGVNDVAFLDAVMNDVESRYAVDVAHTAIGGFSNGAMMSYRYLCERSSRVHTAFIGSGAFVAPTCAFSQPVQILHMHGMKDTVVPWGGSTTSTYTSDGIMPSVNVTAHTVAAAAGCGSSWTYSVVNSLLNEYVAGGCPAHTSIVIYQSMSLMHGWVTGPTAVSTYGINETNLTWNWLLGTWSTT